MSNTKNFVKNKTMFFIFSTIETFIQKMIVIDYKFYNKKDNNRNKH